MLQADGQAERSDLKLIPECTAAEFSAAQYNPEYQLKYIMEHMETFT